MIRAELSGFSWKPTRLAVSRRIGRTNRIMQRQIDQPRGQHRDHQRDQQQIAGKPVHRLPQRLLVDHDLDELRAAGRRPDHADRLVAASPA